MSEIILGIDPGFGKTGFGVIEERDGACALLDFGCIETDAGLPRAARLLDLTRDLEEIILQWKPTVCAIEQLFFAKNKKTAISVSHARGAILVTLERHGIPLFEYTPPQVKLAITGWGAADKFQVKNMVQKLLLLQRPPTPDDAADALAIALCHAFHAQRLQSLT